MRRRRILWQLFPSYLLITFLSVVAIAWYGIQSQSDIYLDQTALGLESRAHLVEQQVYEILLSNDTTGIDLFCKELGHSSETRITVIMPDGKVIADSDEDPRVMDNHSGRPEVRAALEKGMGVSKRYSNTLKQNMMYVAVSAIMNGGRRAVIRTSMPLTVVEKALDSIRIRMIISGLAIALLAAIVSLLVSRNISLPLEKLKAGAQRFASGDLARRLDVPKVEEIGALAEAMNSMAAQLHERIRTIAEQRSEKEAILSSMAEGVIAVDADERVLSFNEVAAEIFNVVPDKIIGRTLHEVVRNVALQQLVGDILKNRISSETELILEREKSRAILQAYGSILRDTGGHAVGVVIVLNDVTKIRELEVLRRDFVSNASHELRTPITTIKGYIETLLDGAMENKDDLERFLKVVEKHSVRLNAIVEDLLDLSRIEQGPVTEFEPGKIVDVISAAVESCNVLIEKYRSNIELSCPPDLVAKINAPLLELAIVNLLENAIKYSDSGSDIKINARRDDNSVKIEVIDQGKGISEEHLGRIFERFYRVDKARSRDHGGTGLGLAIVKHIVLTHQGDIEVDSLPGQGSTFTITIPR